MDLEAAATMLRWLSEVFLRTSPYTRFFSLEGALEMNAAKAVVRWASFLGKNFMYLNLGASELTFKSRWSVFFRNVIVNLVNIGLV